MRDPYLAAAACSFFCRSSCICAAALRSVASEMPSSIPPILSSTRNIIVSFGMPVQRDCCALAIFVPGEPAAAFAQMLLGRVAIARDGSQSSTRQGNSGGAVPSADSAIAVG